MEANQCRLNNIVNYRGQITTLTKNEMVHFYRFSEFYEPIPLTEEILLKCGLKRTLYDSSYELNDFSIFLDKRIRENIYIKCEKRNWNVLNGLRIDCLHQLQNLYFALTNEELTVNL